MKNKLKFILENTASGKIDKSVAAVLLADMKKNKSSEKMDIAVIGMDVSMPQSKNINDFWNNIANNLDCITDFPANRRQDVEDYIRYTGQDSELNYARAGYLEEIDKFDHEFFGMSPKEAELMDPNQRLFLQTAWGAIEDAGYGGRKLVGTRTGVYVGYDNSTVNAYRQLIADTRPELLSLATTGNILPLIASRISHILDFHGPSMLIDTSCSSSLLAIHIASNAIRNGECDTAIAGSVKISMFPVLPENMLGVEATDGRTKAFDDRSDGTGIGEGVGAVLLKPLAKALSDGDSIYAVIKGSAANHDGASIGLTAPNVLAQEDVITRALKNADTPAESIAYIETHGTGTKLGDPIEIDAITRAFRKQTQRQQFCAISSLKSSIGHLDHGSGIASFIKGVLSLKHQQIPPTLHFERPNRNISFITSPVYVNDQLKEWSVSDTPRRCGVSSFGMSGTNCHIILEEAPISSGSTVSEKVVDTEEYPYVMSFSAKTESSLLGIARSMFGYLQEKPTASLGDICFTLATGRGHYAHRLSMVVTNTTHALENLKSLLEGGFYTSENEGIYYMHPERGMIHVIEQNSVRMEHKAKDNYMEFHKICRAYQNGDDMDWSSVFSSKKYRRLNLPVYCFDKVRSWVAVPQNIPVASRIRAIDSQGTDKVELPFVEVTRMEDVSFDTDSPAFGMLSRVASVWGEVMGFQQIAATAHLFELGGDSIFAGRIASLLSDHLGLDINLGEIMHNPILSDLSLYLSGKTEGLTATTTHREKLVVSDNTGFYPLTSSQRRMFVLNQFEEQSITYNMPSAFLITGSLDIERLERSFQLLIDGQDILRTSFVMDGDEVVQQVQPEAPFRLERFVCDEGDISNQIDVFIRPFSLGQAPLLRAAIAELSTNKHLLLFDIHHIICDGASTEIVTRELLRAYYSQEYTAPELQFKDYVVWNYNHGASEWSLENTDFWAKELSGDLPVLNLVHDQKRPEIQSFHGDKVSFRIEKEQLEALKNLAHKNDASLYMMMLALYNVFLFKYSGQNDIIVGSPISGRNRIEVEEMIGMFVNTLPMRNFPKQQHSFEEFLQTVRDRCLLAYRHQEYPFEKMVEHVNIPRDLSRNPIYDVMFMMQNIGLKEITADDLTFIAVHFESKVAKVDLTMNVMEKEDGLSIDFEYATALFDRETVERMVRYFTSMTDTIIGNPTSQLKDYPLVTQEEKATLERLQGPIIPYRSELGIHHLIEQQAKVVAAQPALVFDNESLSYQDLENRAEQLAVALRNKGINPHDRVALYLNRTPELIISMFAVLKVGAAYVPIDPYYPEERISFMLLDSDAKYILYNRSIDMKLPGSIHGIDVRDESLYTDSSLLLPLPAFDSRQLAYIIYTSGSTGKPKGVMVEHRQVHNFIVGVTEKIAFNTAKKLLSVTTFSFDIFVLESLLALSKGITIILANEKEQNHPKLLSNLLQQHEVDMLQITPSRLQLLLNSPEGIAGISALKELMIGGEPLPEALLRKLRTLGKMKIYNMYGPTETTVWSTLKELADPNEDTTITIGQPIANTTVYIVDEHNMLVPIGTPGELLLGGDGVVRGYLNRLELTEEKFITVPELGAGRIYRTGDRARWLANGEIQLLGRFDRLVKLHGYRIELGEIENMLLLHPAVAQAAVVVKGEAEEGILCAYFSVISPVSPQQLKDYLESNLPRYMVPSQYMELTKLPQTPNGKIDRNALPDMMEQQAIVHDISDKPMNEVHRKLTEIWANVLHQEQVSIHDNFFLLGGNSMKAISMIAAAEDEGLHLVINDVFKHQTIYELEEYLKLSGGHTHYSVDPSKAEQIIFDDTGYKVQIHQLAVQDRLYCIYAAVDYTPEKVEEILDYAKQRISAKLYPHYIVPTERMEFLTLEHSDIDGIVTVDQEEFEQMLEKRPISIQELNKLVDEVNESHTRYEQQILDNEIIREYRLAPIEHFFLGKDRFSGTLLRFDKPLDLERFNQAVGLLLEQQGVFRNTLIQKEQGMFWREFDVPDRISIPYTDLNTYDAKSGLAFMEELVSKFFFKDYEEWDSLYYRMALVRENLRDYYLFLPVNHSIFDAMSGEIVKRGLLEYYEALEHGREVLLEETKSYADYVQQVRKGPVKITDRQIMESFNLDQYEQVTDELTNNLKTYSRESSTYLKFEIRTRDKNRIFDSDNSWQIAFDLLTKFMSKYLFNKNLPVSVFYYGRNYQNTKYFNTVGEFIDLIPMVVDTQNLSSEQIAEFIQSRISLAEEYNLNFSNFAVNSKTIRKFPEVSQFVRNMQQKGSVIFNFQGKLEDQEMDVFETLLYKRLMHELNLEEAVNIYFATRYSNEVIQIDISLPFNEDSDKLLSFFKTECSIMSDIEVAKYE